MNGLIKFKLIALETWLKGSEITMTQLAKELGIDEGNFSKMATGKLEPSKSFIKKIMMRTGYGFDALFVLDRESSVEDKGPQPNA